jgi:3-phenylpropionate/cinnamic acid dioxygenase small subunit
MSDLSDITALVHGYARLLDAGDFDGLADLFEHATWRSAAHGTVLRGTSEVRSAYDRIRLYDGSPRTKHLITNLSIDIEPGGESASSHCYFTVLQGITAGNPIEITVDGQYIDTFEKIQATWRFADRLFIVDLEGDQRRTLA